MNREQYLAKRMRFCGTPPDAGDIAGAFDMYSDAEAASLPAYPPALSLVDHYRRLHSPIPALPKQS